MIQSVNHKPRARTIAPRREAFLTLLRMKRRENFCFETLKSFGVNVADEHFGPCTANARALSSDAGRACCRQNALSYSLVSNRR